MTLASTVPDVSVVIPAKNEAENLPLLVEEVAQALAGRAFEVVIVDDGSRDGTAEALLALVPECPWLRVVRHAESCGQSAAIRSGVRMARGALIATLDGDGQNDPAYLPQFLDLIAAEGPKVGLVAGERLGRKEGGFKRFQSRFANAVRSRLLKDATRDTGCGLKVIRRDVFMALPYFDAIHRFLPALVVREGFEVRHVPVVDRPRRHGTSNYGFWKRLGVGIVDLAGVFWLIQRRRRIPALREMSPDAH